MSLPVMNLKAEAALAAAYRAIPEAHCKGLCQESCGPIAMSDYEAGRFTRAAHRKGIDADLQPLDLEPVGRHYLLPAIEGSCPALGQNGACRIYAARPAVCRLWGVVDDMPCPFGCEPDAILSAEAGEELMAHIKEIHG